MVEKSKHTGNQIILKFVGLFVVILILFGGLSLLISTRPGLIGIIEGFVQSYGVLGGISTTFIGSLWFVIFPWEIIVGPILKFHVQPIPLIFIFALAGVGAHWLNFIMGRKLGESFIHKKIDDAHLEQIQGFLDKYGLYTLFFFGVIGPFTSYDVLALFMGGFSKMTLRLFLLITTVAQFLHFLVIFLLADFVISAAMLGI